MKYPIYYGNGAYCYSNSTSMLLSSIGEQINPSLIEVLGGVGIGAYVLSDSNMVFLSNCSGLPDRGISRALTALGFKFDEKALDSNSYFPIQELKALIDKSPVLLGPVDMGYLKYDPSSEHHFGVDHFIVAYDYNENEVCVHDPAEFPNVWINYENLKDAWSADNIGYKRGHYRYWTNPVRISNPSEEDLYLTAISTLKEIYLDGKKYAEPKNKLIDEEAILFLANNIKEQKLKKEDYSLLTGFILPVGAKRSNDFYSFFHKFNPELAEIKLSQSKLLGKMHSLIVSEEYKACVDLLKEYTQYESRFKKLILS